MKFDDSERILSGALADEATGERAHALASALDELRASLAVPPDPELAARHIGLMAAAARDVREAPADAVDLATRPGRRLRRALAAATAGAFLLTGGLASAGNLPGPAQDFVAGAVSHVGIDIPRSSDSDAGAPPEVGDAGEGAPDDLPVPAGGPANDVGTQGDHAPGPEDGQEHGDTVADTAQDEFEDGCEHGQTVAGTAVPDEEGPEPAVDACDEGEPEVEGGSSSEGHGDTSPPAPVPTTTTGPPGGVPTP